MPKVPVPAGEEVGPKLVRLLCFVGAAVLSTAGINKWRDLERNLTGQEHKHQQNVNAQSLENPSNVVQKGC